MWRSWLVWKHPSRSSPVLSEKSRAKHASVALIGPRDSCDRLSSTNLPDRLRGVCVERFNSFCWRFRWTRASNVKNTFRCSFICPLVACVVSIDGRERVNLEWKGRRERTVMCSWRHLFRWCGLWELSRRSRTRTAAVSSWEWQQSSTAFNLYPTRVCSRFPSSECIVTASFELVAQWYLHHDVQCAHASRCILLQNRLGGNRCGGGARARRENATGACWKWQEQLWEGGCASSWIYLMITWPD